LIFCFFNIYISIYLCIHIFVNGPTKIGFFKKFTTKIELFYIDVKILYYKLATFRSLKEAIQMSIEHCSQPIPTDKDSIDADHRSTAALILSLEIHSCVNHALVMNSELYQKLQLRLEKTNCSPTGHILA
jgi:hypothetical protein